MKWLENLEDMLTTFANCADGPESPEAINAGILAEAIKEAKRLRGRAERAERERDAALLGLGRVLSGADAVKPPAGELVAYAREFAGLDAAPAESSGE